MMTVVLCAVITSVVSHMVIREHHQVDNMDNHYLVPVCDKIAATFAASRMVALKKNSRWMMRQVDTQMCNILDILANRIRQIAGMQEAMVVMEVMLTRPLSYGVRRHRSSPG